MFEKINVFCEKWGFEITLVLSLIAILILAVVRYGEKGSYSRTYFYDGAKKKPEWNAGSDRPKESKGEAECRRVLQKMFGKPFISVRPDFLRNPVTGNHNLEIDCFNSELKLGVEYNGIQHYKFVPYFHKNKEAFRNQQYRDLIKNDMCRKNGIRLIEVPHTVKIPDIENYLRNRLDELGIKPSAQARA